MRTKIRWAEVHSDVFIGTTAHGQKGVNLGKKLDVSQREGLVMEYDEIKRHLFVTMNERTVRIPEPSILSMIEGEGRPAIFDFAAQNKKNAEEGEARRKAGKLDAQVATPQSHVFAGQGSGKTGIEEARKKV